MGSTALGTSRANRRCACDVRWLETLPTGKHPRRLSSLGFDLARSVRWDEAQTLIFSEDEASRRQKHLVQGHRASGWWPGLLGLGGALSGVHPVTLSESSRAPHPKGLSELSPDVSMRMKT